MAGELIRKRLRELVGGPHATRRGTVTGIHEDWSDKSLVRVELEDQSQSKGKDGEVAPRRTFDAIVTREESAGYKIGDVVAVQTSVTKEA